MPMLRIGYHVSISASLDLAFDRARDLGCTCMQLFLTNPRSWSTKALETGELERFTAKERSYGIRPVIAHMSYLPNPASPREEVYEKTKAAYLDAVYRCEALGVKYLVIHLGSHLGEGKEKGFERVREAVRLATSAAKNTYILMENEAGQRNSVGSDLDDLVGLYNSIGPKNLGFCIDTCHIFAAGYDITKPEVIDDVLHTLDVSRIHVIHLNDSKYQCGSGLDRHENIGFGKIGRSGFETLLANEELRSKPMILETPGEHSGEGELRLVRRIVSSGAQL